VPRYLGLLRAGGSQAPAALLAELGLDVTDPRFWDGGLAVLAEMVSEAEKLAAAAGAT
jgi:oligoendopeptidase F